MPDEVGRFGTAGLSWAERATLGGLRAVIGPSSSERNNQFSHGIHTYGARRAARTLPVRASVVDFGCGTGRFTRFFAERGCTVLGTEITAEMVEGARVECSGVDCAFALTDGIRIPADDASIDLIWACGVLRFSLFGDAPVHDQIAAEMFRVLRPGGKVINLEVYVDQPPKTFQRDFETAGFVARPAHVLCRYGGTFEHYLKHPIWPDAWVGWLGRRCAQLRYHLDPPGRQERGIRDYLLVYDKPPA
jgi:ubiquinone/menaquinone biosynthesis C-methylase UbiE